MGADFTDSGGWTVGRLLAVQELMKKDYIAFQGGRHHAVHLSDFHSLP